MVIRTLGRASRVLTALARAGAAGGAGGQRNPWKVPGASALFATDVSDTAARAAAIVLPMPKLSHNMTSGRIERWHVREGDVVKEYDVVLTVATETLVEEAYRLDQFKGTVSLLVESQEEGVVARLMAAEGEEVPVGRPIMLLAEGSEAEAEAVREAAPRLLAGLEDVYEQGRGKASKLCRRFTLADLAERAYIVIRDPVNEISKGSARWAPDDPFHACSKDAMPYLRAFHTHLRRALVLANLEACLEHNDEPREGEDRAKAGVDYMNVLNPVSEGDGAPAAPTSGGGGKRDGGRGLAERDLRNREALQPILALLRARAEQPALSPPKEAEGREHCWVCREVLAALIEQEEHDALVALDKAHSGGELHTCIGLHPAALVALAMTLAAYQPSVLDMVSIKGSLSPYDARSKCNTIEAVSKALAYLAMQLVESVEAQVAAPESPPIGLRKAGGRSQAGTGQAEQGGHRRLNIRATVLQAAFMSGFWELVDKLLPRVGEPGLSETDIIKRLRTAWVGYIGFRPLQDWRAGHHAQTQDWLDFKASTARAILIAHRVIDTLRRGDETPEAAPEEQPREQPQAETNALQKASRKVIAGMAEATHAVSGIMAKMHRPSQTNSDGRGTASGQAPAQGQAVAEATEDRGEPTTAISVSATDIGAGNGDHVVTFGRGASSPTRMPTQPALSPGKAGSPSRKCEDNAAVLPLYAKMELTEDKVLAGKREANKKAKEAREGQSREGEGGVRDSTVFLRGSTTKLDASMRGSTTTPTAAGAASMRRRGAVNLDLEEEEEEDDEEARERQEEEARRQAEEESRSRFVRLHRLAVQAAHLAVHSSSLSTVSDALACMKAVRAWGAVDLYMLNDLAKKFPLQCAQLLEAIPLSEVDLEDNVLPFGLPPGFMTVAVSDKEAVKFREEGGTGSTQDSLHFSKQEDEDATIDACLLTRGTTWVGMLLLFLPSELHGPTSRKMLRVAGCAVAAFVCQGPGSCAVAAIFALLLLVVGLGTRALVAVIRILVWGVLARLWQAVVRHFPSLRKMVIRLAGKQRNNAVQQGHTLSGRPHASAHSSLAPGAAYPYLGSQVPPGEESDGDESDGEATKLPAALRNGAALGTSLWRSLIAHGHNTVVDWWLGWGHNSTSISCRQVPFPIPYAEAGSQQLDTQLMERLLRSPAVHPSVYGSKVLRALILFKWNYFTKHFIVLQLLLHIAYMALFLAYAFTIKNMEEVPGRDTGPGANEPGCRLEAPTPLQTGLLIALAVMTLDFLVQETRQIRHFGFRILRHTWDVLDICSVGLVVASITLHFSCTSDVGPVSLRALAAVQILLLFMRLLYFAMASERLGSFVRMVLETTWDLLLFFLFLSVVFVGFGLAIIIAQGEVAQEEMVFIKLFTMLFGDFDVNFLGDTENTDGGSPLGLDTMTKIFASIYMILVTIVLLNLLISIISESYERIRENERWESLRNKALLVVESETQLYRMFLRWLYRTLAPVSQGLPASERRYRYLYVIAPEYARKSGGAAGDDEDGDDEDDDEEDDDESADGQWNGRLGELKRHMQSVARGTVDAVRREISKAMKEMQKKANEDRVTAEQLAEEAVPAAAAAQEAEPLFAAEPQAAHLSPASTPGQMRGEEQASAVPSLSISLRSGAFRPGARAAGGGDDAGARGEVEPAPPPPALQARYPDQAGPSGAPSTSRPVSATTGLPASRSASLNGRPLGPSQPSGDLLRELGAIGEVVPEPAVGRTASLAARPPSGRSAARPPSGLAAARQGSGAGVPP
ncbi:hypothetical protein HYH03_000714 [Edaphochlamys debaryana]|uniref:Ion transport domain-containing protein n=1 Tax=Edaphochlamys debaryana TaxID=47281 RepID=A0A836C7G3_9CHLO|nr:hypothetical protein HYH03_000714 [Edaphochlamys debaryana]|eukprot:KAG2502228.1 hypothetical protein HYH03_000714 [Edaphochlamys debaryana]